MTRHISLINWTDQDASTVKDTVSRGHATCDVFKAAGGNLTDVYWTMGQHDACLIFDAPDAETATRMMLAIAQHDNVRSVTMPAFDEHAMRRMAQRL